MSNNVYYYKKLIGDGVSRDIHIDHQLGASEIIVKVYTKDYYDITSKIGMTHLNGNETMLYFAEPPAEKSLVLIIMGGCAV